MAEGRGRGGSVMGAPVFPKFVAKNGPRFWVKCRTDKIWLMPTIVHFACGEVYQRGQYSVRRRAVTYTRVHPVKGQADVVR